jgi:hypothetical protein
MRAGGLKRTVVVMRRRPLSSFAVALLLAAVSQLGGTSSLAAGGAAAPISAHLTKTSFTASQAGSVKLIYSFSKSSRRFSYLISFSTGSTWQTVMSVTKKGSFTGAHTITVAKLFAGKPVKAGSYRLKLSADAGSQLLTFQVTTGGSGSTAPQFGIWASTSLGGAFRGGGGAGSVTVNSVSFTVSSGNVEAFSFQFDVSGFIKPTGFGTCSSGPGTSSYYGHPSPIANGRFETPGLTGAWSGGGAGTFNGTFDSPTRAHGTATFSASIQGTGCFMSGMVNTGTFTWTAAPKH